MVDLALKPPSKDTKTTIEPVSVPRESLIAVCIKYGKRVEESELVSASDVDTETSYFSLAGNLATDEILLITHIDLSVWSNSSAYCNPRVWTKSNTPTNYLLDLFIGTGSTYPQVMSKTSNPCFPIVLKQNDKLAVSTEGGASGTIYAISNVMGYVIKIIYLQNVI